MAESMQAAVWHGKKDVRVETVPLPSPPAPGWVQVKVEWCCKHAVGAPYWQGTEIFESDECGHTFETMEERQDVIDGRIYANCPRCQGELDKYDADWDQSAI